MKRLFWASVMVLVLAAPSAGTAKDSLSPQLDRLGDLIVERLSLMEDVAAYKWVHKLPVEDKAREKAVIAAGQKAAAALGLAPKSISPFLHAQMDAAKAVQKAKIDRWRKRRANPPRTAPDLAKDLRPAISAVTDALLRQLAIARPQLETGTQVAAFTAHLRQKLTSEFNLKRSAAKAISNGIFSVRYAGGDGPSRLERIIELGVLRVGTTGDYPPFSQWTDNAFAGVDIDLARQLADSLGVRVQFIRTSWPSLMDDLAADRFDIGMSGISRTAKREKVAYFSAPYHRGGKAPIARCADVARLDSLAEIDTAGVRVIVNPGGTNEKFTRKNVRKAQIILFEDNTAIFGEIAAGRADVMITDAIEVAYQAARNPALCPAMKGKTLTVAQKAFLMPQDKGLRTYVDFWLSHANSGGALKAAFERHLKAD